MAISAFIPELWSARLQRHLDRTLVYAQPSVCNRDWEGEISEAGATVHIQKVGDPEIKTYTPGSDMASPEEADGTTLALTVDQFRYFNVSVDDVNKAQVNVNLLDAFAKRAGVKMAQTIDAFVASKIAAAATTNKVGTDAVPVVIKADGTGDFTPYELAVELRRQLAGKDAPLDSLWLGINADFEAEILKDPNYVASGTETGVDVVRNGAIGKIAGFDVLRTNGVPSSAGSGGEAVPNIKILAGAGNYATTFASQVTEMEAYRPEKRFGDAIKGLEVYGAKVLEPETLVQAHVAK
jgi:hypothetical protein